MNAFEVYKTEKAAAKARIEALGLDENSDDARAFRNIVAQRRTRLLRDTDAAREMNRVAR